MAEVVGEVTKRSADRMTGVLEGIVMLWEMFRDPRGLPGVRHVEAAWVVATELCHFRCREYLE